MDEGYVSVTCGVCGQYRPKSYTARKMRLSTWFLAPTPDSDDEEFAQVTVNYIICSKCDGDWMDTADIDHVY